MVLRLVSSTNGDVVPHLMNTNDRNGRMTDIQSDKVDLSRIKYLSRIYPLAHMLVTLGIMVAQPAD